MKPINLAVCLGVLALVLGACGAPGGTGGRSSGTLGPDSGRGGGSSTEVTKLLVVVVENHSLEQMSQEMPYTFGLAQRYGYASDFRAWHPSLPNYLAIAGGDTFGVTDDGPPANHPVTGSSVFGQALGLGKTATVYAEGMPSTCSRTDGGIRYAVRHNPWTYFVDERALCARHDVPLTTLDADARAGNLPNAGMVVPNLCHDAHDGDCDLADADAWVRREVGAVLAGPDFTTGRLAVVVTADEDDGSRDNRVLTTVFHRDQHHEVVDTPLTHYSLTRLYEQVLGAPLLGRARTAPDMAAAFGVRVTGH